MERLKQRSDFLAAAAGAKVPAAAFVLQARDRGDARPPRVGFTVSKKVGDAVEENAFKINGVDVSDFVYHLVVRGLF